MANKDRHRRFGSIRKLPSRRYQVRYLGPDGVMRSAPLTFAKKEEAQRWLTLTEARMARDEWIAPERAKILLKDYAERWISQRPNLRPRTVVEAATSAEVKPEESTKTSSDDHSSDEDQDGAGVVGDVG